MKLTASSTSTSILDLIKAYDVANSTEAEKSVSTKVGLNGIKVEIMRDSTDVYVETVLDAASTASRPVNSSNAIFTFNAIDLSKVFVYGSGTFHFSIV